MLEVLLASALSVILIATLTNLYIKLNHALLRNQQYIADSLTAARLLALFKSEIESAGHIGCARLTADFIVQPYQQYVLTKATSLQVSESELTVEYQAMPTLSILSQSTSNHTITTDDGESIENKEKVVISDCAHAEINQIKSVNARNEKKHITLQQPLRYQYSNSAEVSRLMHHRYYLRQRGTKSDLMKENSDSRHYILQTDITDLHFESDGVGVAYSFKYKNTLWSGYAAA